MGVISTRERTGLPDLSGLRRLLRTLATLDAVLSPQWEYRYYLFDARWARDEQMGSMKNGLGDDVFVHFGPAGGFIKGFAHEAPMTPFRSETPEVWPGVLDTIPAAFEDCLHEPAFCMDEVTFCLWRQPDDAAWKIGPVEFPPGEDPDGSAFLLEMFDGRPATYQAYAREYYEIETPLSAVAHVYEHRPLTAEIVAALNPQTRLADIADEVAEIGYPSR